MVELDEVKESVNAVIQEDLGISGTVGTAPYPE